MECRLSPALGVHGAESMNLASLGYATINNAMQEAALAWPMIAADDRPYTQHSSKDICTLSLPPGTVLAECHVLHHVVTYATKAIHRRGFN